MKSVITAFASTLTVTMLTFGGTSSAVALPFDSVSENVTHSFSQHTSHNILQHSDQDHGERTIYLGGETDNIAQSELVFHQVQGTLRSGNTYTLVPGDSLRSLTNIVNTGPTEGVLQVYLTEISYTTTTSLEHDEWFKEVEFHTADTTTSLYDAIRASQSNENGTLILQERVDQGETHPLDVQVVFPETATAGNDSADRSFAFHIQAVMTDSKILDDGSGHPSGKPGKKHPPGQAGKEHPGLQNSQGKGNGNGNGHGRQNAPGQQRGDQHPGNQGRANAPGQNKGNQHPRTNGNAHNNTSHQEHPEIRSGFVTDDSRGGWFLIILGILSIVTAVITFKKRQPLNDETT